MTQKLSKIEIIRQTETYTCLVGPVLRNYEFLGATCLPSLTSLDVGTIAFGQCSIESSEAEWDEASGQTELRIQVSGAGAAATARILFSATILAAA